MLFLMLSVSTCNLIKLKDWENEVLEDKLAATKPPFVDKKGSTPVPSLVNEHGDQEGIHHGMVHKNDGGKHISEAVPKHSQGSRDKIHSKLSRGKKCHIVTSRAKGSIYKLKTVASYTLLPPSRRHEIFWG